MRSKPNRVDASALPWLALSALLIGVDQLTKLWAEGALEHRGSIPVIDGLLSWTLAYNRGAAFSFLSDASGWQRWFFTVLALAVSTVLVFMLARVRRGDWRQAAPFSLVIAGALGNVIDRLRLGHVVDFIDVYWGDSHWPAFNVADSAISVGAAMLVLGLLWPGKEKSS